MPIKRSPRPESNFVIVSKAVTEDRRLSWAARGVLVYLLGKPDHWVIRMSELVDHTSELKGAWTRRDGMRTIIGELMRAGYLTVSQDRGDGGKFDAVTYIAHDAAQGGISPPAPSPLLDEPLPAQPLPADPPLARNESLARIEKVARTDTPIAPKPIERQVVVQTKAIREPGQKPARARDTAGFDAFWQVYPRKVGKPLAAKAFAAALIKLEGDSQPIADALHRAKRKDHRFRDSQYTPHPTSWLNSEPWNDDLDGGPAPGDPLPSSPKDDAVNAATERLRTTLHGAPISGPAELLAKVMRKP